MLNPIPLIPVIICGGAGTRLWPVSRQTFPKPLLRLSDGQCFLQKTLSRAARLPDVTEILIGANQENYFLLQDVCQSMRESLPKLSFILEPCARNTAAAIAATAEVIRRKWGESALMLVLPADHLIDDEVSWRTAIEQAISFAQHGKIVTLGIKPTRAETGFGYIQFESTPAEAGTRIHPVRRFIEKPDATLAQTFLTDGQHAWNAGMLCMSAQTLLSEMSCYAPAITQSAIEAVAAARHSIHALSNIIELEHQAFAQAPDISIDYALMEHSQNVNVALCDIGWSDIGSWTAISNLTPADEHGNRIEGEVMTHDASDCYIRGNHRLISAIGVENLIIVDTPDALLVTHRDRAQDVKHITARLKDSQHSAYHTHRTVSRPWGTYTILEESQSFKIKRIVVKPGAALSLQMHHHRSEHWTIVCGCAEVINGDDTIILRPSESTHIPAGCKHRLRNLGIVDLILIEVQCGEYLGEDDIIRFDDEYGRRPTSLS